MNTRITLTAILPIVLACAACDGGNKSTNAAAPAPVAA